ncbi:MAG: hypothetical protein GY737_00405 [Desulfobacteraceae bacterium]|nr:hypothetical protein [Desulfobacteraceae bacterium]
MPRSRSQKDHIQANSPSSRQRARPVIETPGDLGRRILISNELLRDASESDFIDTSTSQIDKAFNKRENAVRDLKHRKEGLPERPAIKDTSTWHLRIKESTAQTSYKTEVGEHKKSVKYRKTLKDRQKKKSKK